MESIKVYLRKRSRVLSVDRVGFLRTGIGLMFRSSKTNNLLFYFRKPSLRAFTSLFVFFPFLIIWLDTHNRVLGSEIVKPFRLSVFPPKAYSSVIELPLNKKNRKNIQFFVGKANI